MTVPACTIKFVCVFGGCTAISTFFRQCVKIKTYPLNGVGKVFPKAQSDACTHTHTHTHTHTNWLCIVATAVVVIQYLDVNVGSESPTSVRIEIVVVLYLEFCQFFDV